MSILTASGRLVPAPRVPRIVCAKNARGPKLLRYAVSAVTELLRIVQPQKSDKNASYISKSSESSQTLAVLSTLESDYAGAYFLTGEFTPELYEEECLFADPSIQFTGRDLYKRNLKLLVPFYEEPSVVLTNIREEYEGELRVIHATWRLRTYIKFPWKPLISLDGSTRYELNSATKITSHIESWSISPLEAIAQLFVPSK